jgi:hypothetical protein
MRSHAGARGGSAGAAGPAPGRRAVRAPVRSSAGNPCHDTRVANSGHRADHRSPAAPVIPARPARLARAPHAASAAQTPARDRACTWPAHVACPRRATPRGVFHGRGTPHIGVAPPAAAPRTTRLDGAPPARHAKRRAGCRGGADSRSLPGKTASVAQQKRYPRSVWRRRNAARSGECASSAQAAAQLRRALRVNRERQRRSHHARGIENHARPPLPRGDIAARSTPARPVLYEST